LLYSALTGCTFAAEVTVFGNENKKPKVYLENRQSKGVLVDIIKCVERYSSLKINISLMPWKRAYNSALASLGAVIGLSMTDERLKILDYSDVMFIDELMLVVKKGKEFDFSSIADLKDKRVGGQRGSKYGEEFFQASNVIFTLDEDDSSVSRLKKLLYDRIDVAVVGPGNVGVLSVINSDDLLLKNRDKFSILPVPLKQDANYLGISKKMNMRPFLDEFNKGLAQCKASGKHQQIVDQYMGP
jgi:ABC-type amino acid transport substrate-binding protein